MTHMRQMHVSEGEFQDWERAVGYQRACRNRHCGEADVWCCRWDSNDGAYEDYRYECRGCGKTWWVDGIDS
jgi:hypothetical protein